MSGTAGAAPAAAAVRAATGVSLDISQILRLQQGSGRAVSLARCAAPRCNAANLGASPLPARGARPLLRNPLSWPGRGQARTGRSRRLGWRPRSGGSCLPPPRTCECQTVPGPGPPRCCASQAPRRNGNPCRLKILLTYVQIPPSSPASAGQGPASLELAPFRGVRYAQDRVSGLAEVTSPPYDVIFRDKEDQLMAADPHNVVRLILPRPVPGRPGQEYHHAAARGRVGRAGGRAAGADGSHAGQPRAHFPAVRRAR